jgi:hypothetical protein
VRKTAYVIVFGFHSQKRCEIRPQFDGGAITSDGGGLFLREVEKRIGMPLREKRVAQVRSLVHGHSGFCRGELMTWCEANRVEYLLGLAKSERLKAEIAREMGRRKHRTKGPNAPRLFKELVYQTRESWSRVRRVVAKVEHLEKGENRGSW